VRSPKLALLGFNKELDIEHSSTKSELTHVTEEEVVAVLLLKRKHGRAQVNPRRRPRGFALRSAFVV